MFTLKQYGKSAQIIDISIPLIRMIKMIGIKQFEVRVKCALTIT